MYVASLPALLQKDAGRVVRWEEDPESSCAEVHAIGAESAYQSNSPYRPTFCPFLSLPARCGDRVLIMKWARTCDAAPQKCPYCKTLGFDPVCPCAQQPTMLPMEGCTANVVVKREINDHIERARVVQAAAVRVQFDVARAAGRRGDRCGAGQKREPASGLRIGMFASAAHPPEHLGKDAGYYEVVATANLGDKPASIPM